MDVEWQKVEALIVKILRGCHCLVRFIYTDGDSCTAARQRLYCALRRRITELYSQLHIGVDPRIARIVLVTLRDKFELLNAVGTFNACISSDLIHWLRTCLDRLLTTDHVLKVRFDGPEISQDTVCAAIPDASVVAGFKFKNLQPEAPGRAGAGDVHDGELVARSEAVPRLRAVSPDRDDAPGCISN
jgi:hypothetical protein